MSWRNTGARVQMKSQSSFLFSLLLLTLLQPSQLYSFKNCLYESTDEFVCSYQNSCTFTDIPKSATSIYASSCNILSIRHSDLSGFYKLKTLSLSNNKISYIEEGAFSDLSALTDLDLSDNQLTLLTDNMFKGLSNLSSLLLNDNKINSISKFAFEPLNKLQKLYLSNNYLVQSAVTNILIHCPSLQTLFVDHNRLTSFQPYNSPFPLLKSLSLEGNNLTLFETEKSPFLFQNLTALYLSSTLLRKFSVHSDVFPRLKSLSLSFVFEPVVEWDISDKAFFRSLTGLVLFNTSFTIQTYRMLFQLVDSVEQLYLAGIGRLFDKGLLDFACSIPSLQQLDLSYNHISVLNDSLLQFCTILTELNLSYNSMTHMTEASLQMLTKLNLLNLDSNYLSRIPVAIRNMTTLTYLTCKFNNIRELQCSDFLNLLSLRKLYLYGNTISKLSSCVFRSLTNLKHLDVRKNRLLQLDDCFDATFPKLYGLLVSENNIGWLYKGVFQNMSSLRHLNVESIGVSIVEGGAFEGLHNLTDLTLSTESLEVDTFAGLPRLQTLTLSLHYVTLQLSTTDPLFNLPSLQTLHVTVTGDTIYLLSQNVFKGLGNLKILTSNKFICLTPHKDTFIYTPHLEQLFIKDNYEFNACPELFHPLTELKILKLTHSKIKSVDFLSKANLTKLEKLILDLNDIKVVNETVFKALPSLKYLDLSENPFVCNCSNAGFIDWVIRNKQVQVVSAFQYKCSSPPSEEGHFLLDFNVQSCWEFTAFLCFMSSSALVLVTLLSSFIYHFLRWQLVYGFYLLQAFLYDSKKRRQGCPHIYDAFVSYNVHDEDWVYGELMAELEERQGWRLCLHHRDFQPGKLIIENITDAIYSSRKTLCVISRHYLQSEWCSREIQMASFRLFDERNDVLILLFLEEISSNQLSPFYRMRKLVKSRTYLSWTQAQSHKGLFWEKVRRALECGNEPGGNHDPLVANV